ncbi:MAG: putative nucleotidyltransferase substrate binding domain-containing protein [Pseudomonadota bacterium]
MVAPSELSRFDRDHLKDAFAIVSRSQQAASLAFTGGQF